MPRYAKSSLERAIYRDLQAEAKMGPPKSTRRNSRQSRAHRLEALTDTPQQPALHRLEDVIGAMLRHASRDEIVRVINRAVDFLAHP